MVLQDLAVLQDVYNTAETGIMLSTLNSVKVLVQRGNHVGYGGTRGKRTTITADESVRATGRF